MRFQVRDNGIDVYLISLQHPHAGGGGVFGVGNRFFIHSCHEVVKAFWHFVDIVTAFQGGENVAETGADFFSCLIKKVSGSLEVQQKVVLMGVEARRNGHHIGLELFDYGQEILQGALQYIVGAARRQGNVDSEAFAFAGTDLIDETMARESRILVHRPVQHLVGVVKYVRSAVAQVPVYVSLATCSGVAFMAFFKPRNRIRVPRGVCPSVKTRP